MLTHKYCRNIVRRCSLVFAPIPTVEIYSMKLMGQGVVAQDALITHARKMQARAGELNYLNCSILLSIYRHSHYPIPQLYLNLNTRIQYLNY